MTKYPNISFFSIFLSCYGLNKDCVPSHSAISWWNRYSGGWRWVGIAALSKMILSFLSILGSTLIKKNLLSREQNLFLGSLFFAYWFEEICRRGLDKERSPCCLKKLSLFWGHLFPLKQFLMIHFPKCSFQYPRLIISWFNFSPCALLVWYSW